MHVRTLLAAMALLAMSLSAAVARDLTIAVRDPDTIEAIHKVFVTPFQNAAAIPVVEQTRTDGTAALTAALKVKDPAWDVIQVDPVELLAGCAAGLFQKLDYAAIGGKDHYLPIAISDCGVGGGVTNTVLAWDRDKFKGSPTWADFFDVTKFPGKRGLRKGVRGNLEIALLADGVAPQDVYKTLATKDGIARAFRKLDQLRPYIVWWKTPADAAKILASGDVLMTSAPSDAILAAGKTGHRDFGIQWNGSLYDVWSWAIAKTTPNPRQAQDFLYFAGTPAIEGRLVGMFGQGGLAHGANDLLPPPLAAISPTSAPNLKNALRVDAGFWRDNLDKLRQRFDAWMAH